jgi:REP element-mobilizing transposase RayT
MRPLRYLPPNTSWFVTSRCLQAQYLLRPDEEMKRRFGYWLGRALKRYPRIELFAAGQMSNHLHLVLKDASSELASFMAYFEANLAKAINQLWKRTGTVFHRRYSAEPILDEAAFDDRILYTVMNPVRAGLVRTHERWPGILLWAKNETRKYTFEWFDETKYDRHRERRILYPKREYLRKSNINVASFPNEEALRSVIKEDDERIGQLRKGLGVLGVRKVLKQDPFSAPESPKKYPRPKCHTTCDLLRRAFREQMTALRDAYCEVSAAFRRGNFLDTHFGHLLRCLVRIDNSALPLVLFFSSLGLEIETYVYRTKPPAYRSEIPCIAASQP